MEEDIIERIKELERIINILQMDNKYLMREIEKLEKQLRELERK